MHCITGYTYYEVEGPVDAGVDRIECEGAGNLVRARYLVPGTSMICLQLNLRASLGCCISHHKCNTSVDSSPCSGLDTVLYVCIHRPHHYIPSVAFAVAEEH